MANDQSKPFECPRCTSTFKAQRHLDQHLQDKQHDLQLECPYCTSTFKAQEHLDQHIRDKEHEVVFECPRCTSTFKAQQHLDQHLQDKKHKKIPCTICSREFTTSEGRDSHHQDVHTWLCSWCHKRLPNSTTEAVHWKADHAWCERCKTGYTNEAALAKHNSKVHVKCSFCEFVADHPEAIQAHLLEAHHFECNDCELLFHLKIDLRKHLKSIIVYTCIVCNVSFESLDVLGAHNELEHSNSGKSLFGVPSKLKKLRVCPAMKGLSNSCVDCSGIFQTDAELEGHYNTLSHLAYCHACPKKFRTWHELKIHLQDDHGLASSSLNSGENNQQSSKICKQFRCPECTEVLDSGAELLNHQVIVHELGRVTMTSVEQATSKKSTDKTASLNACSQCPAWFVDLPDLESHTSSSHYTICPICKRSMANMAAFKQHLLISHVKTKKSDKPSEISDDQPYMTGCGGQEINVAAGLASGFSQDSTSSETTEDDCVLSQDTSSPPTSIATHLPASSGFTSQKHDTNIDLSEVSPHSPTAQYILGMAIDDGLKNEQAQAAAQVLDAIDMSSLLETLIEKVKNVEIKD